MCVASLHQRPPCTLQEQHTLPGAAPCVSRKRGLRIEDIIQRESPPTKRRRVEPAHHRDKCNLQHFVVHIEDDLRTFHSPRRQPNSGVDVLVQVRNAPADVATSGPLPRIFLSRHGLLDGRAGIHNAPSTLPALLPPIQSLDDRRPLCPILEPAPLRPWRIGSWPSLLADMEHMATEYVEDSASSLDVEEARLQGYPCVLSEQASWHAKTVRDEGSPDYNPSPISPISTPPPITDHADKLGDRAKSEPTHKPEGPASRATSVPLLGGP
ncbi:MAG: hypothetical protein M1840_005416 [Geoglossum simile]|nr:MAG: hypothetical protein M1840_005416 [Geoglossum simile]